VVPLPDLVHVATPLFIGQTGNDLILRSRGEGETPLLLEMAQSTKFLEPLAAFRHRCAYGNVKEDLLVPIGTALFHPGPESMEGTGHILKETVVLPDGAREDVRM
ncbi:hydrolase-like protein, partial [Nannochloropsis gaditana CCMP526]